MNTPTPPPLDEHLPALIRMAIHEDLGPVAPDGFAGDKTVELSIPPDLEARGSVVARSPGVVAGLFLLEAVAAEYGLPAAGIFPRVSDGTRVTPGQIVLQIAGNARALLSMERVLLNFLCHLSGIATLTRRFVDAVAPVAEKHGGRPAICDTRKTLPGYRALDKYAVRCGGGANHRMGLYDGVMLKDNHLAALRVDAADQPLSALTGQIRANLDRRLTLWLEVDTLAQLAEALGSPGAPPGADIILLDNFTPDQMRQAVRARDEAQVNILLEASGGITLDNVRAVAETGVDRISIGALTHSAPVLDLSMDFAR